MSYVYGVTFALLGLIITFPGLVSVVNLLLPGISERSYLRVTWTPFVSLLAGIPVTGILLIWVFAAADGGLTVVALLGAAILMGLWSLGMGGVARLTAERVTEWRGSTDGLSNLVRGALLLILAMLAPIAGWLLVFPVVTLIAVGASCFALVGWVPKRRMRRAEEAEAMAVVPHEETLPVLSAE